MKTCRNKLLILFFLVASCLPLLAQKDLQISKVFDLYGERKGVVMVDLTGEVLEGYNFELFKSITIKNDPPAADYIRRCLSIDQEGAKKVKQVVANGKPTTIYLQLPRRGSLFRLILFNESLKPEQVSLIYIESKTDSEDVLKMILKKK